MRTFLIVLSYVVVFTLGFATAIVAILINFAKALTSSGKGTH